MRISEVAVVHHETPELLRRALAALYEAAPDVPVRVVDTGRELHDTRRAAGDHPLARVVAVPNHSYAFAVNDALKHGQGELIVVMNADVGIRHDTLDALAAPFGDPDVALVGPLARTPDGRLQDQGLPYRWLTRSIVGRGPSAARDVPWLSGFLFAVRREAARHVGGMDSGFRFFNEDLEWSFRLRRAGWRCRLVGAEVEHVGGAATPTSGRFLVEGLRGGMIVADRLRGPMRRELQRAAVGAVASIRARVGPPTSRSSWSAVARMMRSGRYDVTPFGPTLAEDAPGFPDTWPPEPNG